MMMELNITRTRIGAITITAAAVDDATGWIMLAAVGAMVRADFDVLASVTMIGLTVGFAALMVFLARPLLRRWIRFALRRGDGELGLNSLAILVVVVLLCAIATNLIGIFAIFGAFIAGAVLSDEHEFRAAVARQLRNFVTVFFLPIFFTYTGLNTDIGTLETPALWLFAAAVSLAAIVGKFGGCSLAAWFGGFPPRESACIGVMMNTRALMELIVINVGYSLKVIPPSVFCMLVMMALLTTVMTTPILLRLQRGTELESYVAESGFGSAVRSFDLKSEEEASVTNQEP
jgi:Kef-type K+ transport system membrane component KefB